MLCEDSFYLLRAVLLDGRNIFLNYFSSPDADITDFDQGLRAQLANADALYDELRAIIREMPFGTIIGLRDTFRLTTVVFRSGPDEEGFYSVGPFRSLPYEENDYTEILKENGLDIKYLETFRTILQSVPCNIIRTEPIAVAKNILLSAYELTEPIVKQHNMLAPALSAPATPKEDINVLAKRTEEVYFHEDRLLSFIREGNDDLAIKEAQFFMHSNMDQRLPARLLSHRSLLYSANTLFRKAAQSDGIHPVYLDEISRRFATKLSTCATHAQLNDVYLEMIHDYCRLCRENATKGYSPNIQKVLHYIQFNLSEDLTPAQIAEAVNFSPAYISRRFKEEVGMSLNAYIYKRRMDTSAQLLEKTNMTVREIAAYVGIPDWNYFTKLFKKATGFTPSEYRKTLKK